MNKGRYSSQVLLDEAAVFSCMAYVDLNPVRAGIVEKLEDAKNTSVKKRLAKIKAIEPIEVQSVLDSNITSLSKTIQSKTLSMSLRNYIELVEWTGRNIVHPNKAKLPTHIISSLKSLNLQPTHWLKQIEHFNQHYCHVVGPVALIRERAKQLKKCYLKGISAAKLHYLQPS